jgi:hypothetical protein
VNASTGLEIVHTRKELRVSVLLAALMLCTVAMTANGQAPTGAGSIATEPGASRLLLIPMRSDDPHVQRACQRLEGSKNCQRSLGLSGPPTAGGGSGLPESGEAQDLLVEWTLQDVTNIVVAGNGVGGVAHGEAGLDVSFDFDIELGVPVTGYMSHLMESGGMDAPPGMTYYHGWWWWSDFILDACGNLPPVIPVDFKSTAYLWDVDGMVGEDPLLVTADFHGVDNNTVVPTGFWNYHYTIRVVSPDTGDASDFVFRGMLSAVCANDLGNP